VFIKTGYTLLQVDITSNTMSPRNPAEHLDKYIELLTEYQQCLSEGTVEYRRVTNSLLAAKRSLVYWQTTKAYNCFFDKHQPYKYPIDEF